MKHLQFIIIILLFLTITVRGQNNVGINDNNSTPNASAMLDVYSTSKGMLIPRIALTATTAAAPVSSPAASLLIYNTATTGDVTPGYYYWNGSSKWVRLIGSTDPEQAYNLTVKTANATLLKTENMVLASGNTTLILPVITSADNGIEITVKNIGTYTDMVTVTPQSGKTIDANTTSTLTRWKSRTFIAYGTNWMVKEKDARTENMLDVCSSGSFTTIAEAVAFLAVHMNAPTIVRVGGGIFPIATTQTIDLPYPVTFTGSSYGETTISADAGVYGTPLFTCLTECYFKMLIFETTNSSSGNDAIHFDGTGEYHEVKDCVFNGFNKGIVTSTNSDIWLFESDFEDCTGAGVEIAGSTSTNGSIRMSECDFYQCNKGVNLLSGISWTVSIMNCTFYNTPAGTNIGINYNPTAFTSFSSIIIASDGWNNAGTFISGFDFSRTDGRDANAYIDGNYGTESKRPHFNIGVTNNTSTATLTTANNWYKCNWTNTTTYPSSWLLGNNKCTYLPVNKRDVIMWISGSVSDNNTNRTLTVGVVKNGISSTRYGEMKIRTPSTANQPTQFSTTVYLGDVSPGDYFELYISSASSGDIVRIWDLTWFSNSQ